MTITASRARRRFRSAPRRRRLAGLAPPAPALAGDAAAPLSLSRRAAARSRALQLGVGRSVIVDLPEDAAEIFVGEPKVANAIVRSARRHLYFHARERPDHHLRARRGRPQDRDARDFRRPRRRGAGRRCSTPRSRATTFTSAPSPNSIILTGSVASAGDAQKAYDIATVLSTTNRGDERGRPTPRPDRLDRVDGSSVDRRRPRPARRAKSSTR